MGSRRAWIWIAIVDVMILLFAFVTAFEVRFGWPPPTANYEPFRALMPFLAGTVLIINLGFGLYDKHSTFGEKVRKMMIAEGLLLMTIAAMTFWLRGFALPRSVMFLALIIHFCLDVVWRGILWCYQRVPQKILVVGQANETSHIRDKLLAAAKNRSQVVHTGSSSELFGSGFMRFKGFDTLVIGPSVTRPERQMLVHIAMKEHITVQVIPTLVDILVAKSTPSHIDDLPVLEIHPLAPSPIRQITKRIFDLAFASMLSILLLPVLAITWILIKTTSRGPALFSQERVGRGGRIFLIRKFRTMVVDAESETGPVLATAGDPRVTTVGTFLRATRLDELPQLWNVITGDMSLVGPRPERPFFVIQFERQIPEYDLRHTVAPGITGLAQVMGRYVTSMEDKLRFDLHYIRHESMWLDLRILLLTVNVVLSKGSATGTDPNSSPIRSAVGD